MLDELDIRMLRPREWVREEHAHAGSPVAVLLDELNVAGNAYVTFVGPARRLAWGDRCPATGLVRHVSRDVITVTLARGSPLEVTAHHRLFSQERGEWMAAGDLRDGELLRTRDGGVRVREVLRAPRPPTEVFNLEVIGTQQYWVGTEGVLAHNGYLRDTANQVSREWSPVATKPRLSRVS